MSNRFWIGNTGNWGDTAHWSTISGGTGGASVPTSGDSVYFNSASFTLNGQVVTLNVVANCLDIDWTGINNTVTLSSSVNSINIYGSLVLQTGLTWTFTGTAYTNMIPSGNVNITTNGVSCTYNKLNFIGTGTINHTDDFNLNVYYVPLIIVSGNWNTNGFTIKSQIAISGNGTRIINLSNSTLLGFFRYYQATNVTLNVGTSTIDTNEEGYVSSQVPLYNVIFRSSYAFGQSIANFGTVTCFNLTFIYRAAIVVDNNIGYLAGNVIVNNNLTITGYSNGTTRSGLLQSNIKDTRRTITVDPTKVFASNCDFQDIAFSSPVDLSNIVGGSQDFGNNSNITFTPGIDCYYKGTTGAHNWSVNWKAIDRTTPVRVPLIQDNAKFDSQSFTGTSTVNLDIAATCKNIDFTGINKTLTLSSSVNSINIYGSVILASGLTWTFTSTAYVYLNALSGTTVNITTNGVIVNMNQIFIAGSGSFTHQDNFISNNNYFWMNAGTWNTNNKNISVNIRIESGSANRTLNLGSSYITGWFRITNNMTNLIVNPGTSTIDCSTGYVNGLNAANTVTLYNVIIRDNGTAGQWLAYFICNNLSFLEDTAQMGVSYLNGDVNVNNNLTIIGYNSTTNRRAIVSNTLGTQQTINVNPLKVFASNCDFRDIKFSGTTDLSAISGGSGDCGGNSNIIFTPSQTQYYKHTSGACNWSDAKWYDLGRTVLSRVPLPQDDAIFDDLSFTGSSNLTVNVPRICRSLDMSGVNQSVTYLLGNNIEVYGSYTLGNSISPSGNYTINLMGRSNYNFNSFSKSLYQLYFNSVSGTYTNNSNIIISANFTCLTGTFDLNDYNLNANKLDFSSSSASVYMGNGITTLSLNVGNSLYILANFYCENSTIISYANIANTNIIGFITSNKIFNKLQFAGIHTGTFDIQGSNTIAELTIKEGRKIRFTSGTTTTIGKLTAVGTPSQPITISGVTNAIYNLKIASGSTDNIITDYCNISYSNATPANRWFAEDSIDGGNNTGWIFNSTPTQINWD